MEISINNIIFFVLIFFVNHTQAQIIEGKVLDENNDPLFAVNVFLKKSKSIGTVTNLDGAFKLAIKQSQLSDTLILSSIGFLKAEFPIKEIINNSDFILKESSNSLNDIIVFGKKAISQEFSVISMKQIDIYLNPFSKSDPLNAITLLPYSTNIDESANLELRGSNFRRSSVFLNNVPLNNPVRANQNNGIGFFSILNTAVIKEQNVYAGNPPLTKGFSSGGLLEIETNDEVSDNLSMIIGAANIGLLYSQNITNKSFMQLFSNYGFSNFFSHINTTSTKDIKGFNSIDLGINYHYELNKKWSLNSYSYYLNDQNNISTQILSVKDDLSSSNLRFFSILNLNYKNNKDKLDFNFSVDSNWQKFHFTNLISNQTAKQHFFSFDYKKFLNTKFSYQTGIAYKFDGLNFDENLPLFFYANSSDSPTINNKSYVKKYNLEEYLYFKWKPLDKLISSFGIRTNSPFGEENPFVSYSVSFKYLLDDFSYLISYGKYNNFTIPSNSNTDFQLLSSEQLSLELKYNKFSKIQLFASAFLKKEKGNDILNNFYNQIFDERKIYGLELFAKNYFLRCFETSFSYTYLNSRIFTPEASFRSTNDLAFLFKFSLSYINLKLFNFSVGSISRNGSYYTSIIDSNLDENTGFYEPVFNTFNDSQLNNYHTINLTLSKQIKLESYSVLAFTSVNNIFNRKNQQSPTYSNDYESISFSYFGKRIYYFGILLNLK